MGGNEKDAGDRKLKFLLPLPANIHSGSGKPLLSNRLHRLHSLSINTKPWADVYAPVLMQTIPMMSVITLRMRISTNLAPSTTNLLSRRLQECPQALDTTTTSKFYAAGTPRLCQSSTSSAMFVYTTTTGKSGKRRGTKGACSCMKGLCAIARTCSPLVTRSGTQGRIPSVWLLHPQSYGDG